MMNNDFNNASQTQEPTKCKINTNPMSNANLFSRLYFYWVLSYLRKGYNNPLTLEDLPSIRPQDNSEFLGHKLERLWKSECVKPDTKNNLKRALIKMFQWRFLAAGSFSALYECCFRLMQGIFLGQLLQSLQEESLEWYETPMAMAAGMVIANFVTLTSQHNEVLFRQMTGLHMRTACGSLIFRKCLRLSKKACNTSDVGKQVNLLSNDMNRFDALAFSASWLVVGPLQTAIVIVILWFEIGPYCIFGLVFGGLALPLQSKIGSYMSNLREKTSKKTDHRITLMNEIINGIKVVKMYAWEKPFTKLVEETRSKEVKLLKKSLLFYLAIFSYQFCFTHVTNAMIFIPYAIFSGESLTSKKVFVTVTLFHYVRTSLALFFPMALANYSEAMVTISRVQEFLELEECQDLSEVDKSSERTKLGSIIERKLSTISSGVVNNGFSDIEKYQKPLNSDVRLDASHVSASWTVGAATLDDVTISVSSGQLMAVIGEVGSGKSSLLQAILGELPLKSGSITLNGNIGYFCQETWIFPGSVRDNILVGRSWDPVRYHDVINACALSTDLKMFKHGDQTLVGERGASLSGGQKARVALARALYMDADIYLLDDPLSAVDTHVARYLYENCIMGFLKDKIKILVTHQIHFVKNADSLLVLNNGRVEGYGTFEELQRQGVELLTKENSDEESHMIPSVPNMPKESEESEEIDHLVQKENEESVSSGGAYKGYIKAAGGAPTFLIALVLFIGTQGLSSAADYLLTIWTGYEENQQLKQVDGQQNATAEMHQFNREEYIYIYGGLVGLVVVASLVKTLHFAALSVRAGFMLHGQMFSALIRTPIKFFEVNPSGRVLNRFSKDTGTMDEQLPGALSDTCSEMIMGFAIIIIVAVINPYMLLAAGGVCVIMVWYRGFYLATAKVVKRLESVARSPVFSHLGTTLQGLTTIRAHRLHHDFRKAFDHKQNVHASAWFMFITLSRHFAVWMELLCTIFVAIVTFTVFQMGAPSNEVGLAISSVLMLGSAFQYALRQSAETQNFMVAVERVIEFTKLPSEKEVMVDEGQLSGQLTHPSKGELIFEDVSLSYDDLDNDQSITVLHNISMTIQPGEKIGVVGRTGAGKSSLITALFRLVEPQGRILLDGVDTKSIHLSKLRPSISIIPQDPVLFTGSLRYNLDPFGNNSDEEIWNALKQVELEDVVRNLYGGIASMMSEGGTNFSVGQRQLVCLARALHRNNKILVLDEATASVDPKTDELIQTLLRTRFADCTMITIAHRLHTIMDSDKVLVMDKGCVKEFDIPFHLLQNSRSQFSQMVEQTGEASASNLKEQAERAMLRKTGLQFTEL